MLTSGRRELLKGTPNLIFTMGDKRAKGVCKLCEVRKVQEHFGGDLYHATSNVALSITRASFG